MFLLLRLTPPATLALLALSLVSQVVYGRSFLRHSGRGSTRCAAFRVTPYKVKDGETLDSVAEQHGLNVQELLTLNHELDLKEADKNPTILVPQGKISGPDRGVLQNMKARRYRTYAVKRNEDIDDILGARDIDISEFERLNPDVDADGLTEHEIIKLPAHKYSPQEQYEMHGTLGGPQAFSLGSWVTNTAIVGTLAIAWYCTWLYRQGRKARRAAEVEKKIAAARKNYKVPEDLPTPSYLASLDEPDAEDEADCPSPG